MVTHGYLGQRIMWVLWPAFLMASVAETLFFTVFDPADMHAFGVPVEFSRQGIYTAGFFLFWVLCTASSALTVFLERSPWESHRCPLDADRRPTGCPRRDEPPKLAG